MRSVMKNHHSPVEVHQAPIRTIAAMPPKGPSISQDQVDDESFPKNIASIVERFEYYDMDLDEYLAKWRDTWHKNLQKYDGYNDEFLDESRFKLQPLPYERDKDRAKVAAKLGINKDDVKLKKPSSITRYVWVKNDDGKWFKVNVGSHND